VQNTCHCGYIGRIDAGLERSRHDAAMLYPLNTLGPGMHIRTAAWQPPPSIDGDAAINRSDAYERRLRALLAAANARSHRYVTLA
jgi:hypothetical protein